MASDSQASVILFSQSARPVSQRGGQRQRVTAARETSGGGAGAHQSACFWPPCRPFARGRMLFLPCCRDGLRAEQSREVLERLSRAERMSVLLFRKRVRRSLAEEAPAFPGPTWLVADALLSLFRFMTMLARVVN